MTDGLPEHRAARNSIEIADQSLNFRQLAITDLTPTGAQLIAAAGFRPAQSVIVLQLLDTGGIEDIRPEEIADLQMGKRFVIAESDREYMFAVDGQRYSWPLRLITGEIIRKIAAVATGLAIYLERADEPDRLIDNVEQVDLDARGIESFISRKPIWKLNVQGVILELPSPSVSVREAITEAGFDPNQEWHIFLKAEGQPKKEVSLDYVVDLKTPGIEKLRLTPKNVNNGEGPGIRREFEVLAVDESFLDKTGLPWETLIDLDRRWLKIFNYPIPDGYNATTVTLALEVPPGYPGAQIDMFYTNPPLTLASGAQIECTHIAATIRGENFNGWSRHRGPGSEWSPARDNVVTHLALVESALAKEIGE